jgi:hypothetical protein
MRKLVLALVWAGFWTATASLAGVLLTAVWWSGDVADNAADDSRKTAPRPPVVQLPHAGGVETFKFFADGCYLLTRSVPGEVMLWDARSGQRLGWLDDPGDTLGTWRSYALAPDERRLITWAPRAGLVLWDAETIKQIRTLREADGQSSRPIFAISPDSRSVLLAGRDPDRRLELHAAPGETGSQFFGARRLNRKGRLPGSREPAGSRGAGGKDERGWDDRPAGRLWPYVRKQKNLVLAQEALAFVS